jgi:hypothetical protein
MSAFRWLGRSNHGRWHAKSDRADIFQTGMNEKMHSWERAHLLMAYIQRELTMEELGFERVEAADAGRLR